MTVAIFLQRFGVTGKYVTLTPRSTDQSESFLVKGKYFRDILTEYF